MPRGNYIYALVDPRDATVRYIGKAQGYLNSRFRRHLREARQTTKQTRKLRWLRSVLADGLEPEVRVLVQVATPDLLGDEERAWIVRLRDEGAPLTNMTDGGEGMPNPPPETRVRLRARPQVGFPPAAREAARKRMQALWADPVYRQKMQALADVRRGAPKPVPLVGEELRNRRVEIAKAMGAANRGRPKSSEHRAKLAAAIRLAHAEGRLPSRRGVRASEETRAKLRAAWRRRKEVVPCVP